MFKGVLRVLGGDPRKRELDRYSDLVEQINAMEEQFEALSVEALANKTVEFRQRLAEGESLDELLPEAFAAVREASKRTIGLRHYDVQLIGGMALHFGRIAEMRTGEGKTLVATLPLYLNALNGRGTHLVTVNDYLARRDARWMSPIYLTLGMSVGVLQMATRTENGQKAFVIDPEKVSPHEDQHQLRMVLRKEAYDADMTYGTNSEFGFDYLRDNLTSRKADRVQRGHHYAIVDEVDNILIDEARTPLIISGPASQDVEWYARMAAVVRQMVPEDYEISEKDRTVTLTEVGEAHVEEILQIPLRDPDRPEDITPEQARLLGYLEQSMRAQFLFKRNKDYLVQAGKVVIVDEFTGRLMPGRRWSEGLHQAVEAKEGVNVEPENITYATITLQNYFRMYEKLCGMTGTAQTEAEEFYKIYKLDVFQIPTNLEYRAQQSHADLVEVEDKDPDGYKYSFFARRGEAEKTPLFWRRKDYPDVVYRTEEAKLRALVSEIITYHVQGRPMLVGTTSVEHSDRLSERLGAEPLRRFAQTLLIRDAWQVKNKRDVIDREVKELQPLNRKLEELKMDDLRQIARPLDISLNPEEPANLETLLRVFNLRPEYQERLLSIFRAGIPHKVLNARKHDEESQIIAGAGAFGAVTIATNMAGRGVDIKLGGELSDEILNKVIRVLDNAGHENPYDMTNEERSQALLKLTPEDYGVTGEEAVHGFFAYMNDMQRVRSLGGLHVIGSERHEARRIDNQLRGRAARQGDPGSSRFYLSLEDDLMRLFGGQQAEGLLKRFNFDEHLPIEMGMLGRLVEQSQERVEGSNFDVRKHLLEYDDVLNAQRKRIYEQRDRVFDKEDLTEDVLEMLRSELTRRIPEALKDEEGPWKFLAFVEEIQPAFEYGLVYSPSFAARLLLDEVRADAARRGLRDALLDLATRALQAEHEHAARWAGQLLDRGGENLVQALSDRLDTLDTFLSGLEDSEPAERRRPQEYLEEASELVRVPLRLSGELLRQFPGKTAEIEAALRQQVETFLTTVTVNRSLLALQRRLGEALTLRSSQLQGGWEESARVMADEVENVLAKRSEALTGPEGQIAHDLDVDLRGQDLQDVEDRQLLIWFNRMAQGERIAFDRRTHRQGRQRYNRLNYIYLAARVVDGYSSEQMTEMVLQHLEGARETLERAWGVIEFERLALSEVNMARFGESLQNTLAGQLDPQRYAVLAGQPMSGLEAADRDLVAAVLGKRMQNEVYRGLLLNVISEQWVDYLTKVEALRVTIGLEAYAQKNPLVEYKNKATRMFGELLNDIRMGVVSKMFVYRPRRGSEAAVERKPEAAPEAQQALPHQAEGGKRKRHRH
jgi:preprotein translocase subunit SecA